MSYNKAQFQVAFKPSDLIDNLKSAQIAALGRDKTIAQLNKMSNLDNPWAKLTAYSALGRFAQQYQHEKIEALGGSGIGEMQKQYMRDVSSYIEQKTAHAKKQQDIVGRIREANVFSIASSQAGMENYGEAYSGGEGGRYFVEGEEAEISAELGGAMAAAQARSEFGLELEQGRERFGSLLSQARVAMGGEEQLGSLSEAPPETKVGGRRRELGRVSRYKSAVRFAPGFEPQSAAEEMALLREEMQQEEAYRRVMGIEGFEFPEAAAEYIAVSRTGGGRKALKRISRSKQLSEATTVGIITPASFEEVFQEEGGGSFSLFDKPSSLGGGPAIDYNQIVYDFIAEQGTPAKAQQYELEAWEEYLQKLVRSGQKPVSFSRFKKDYYRSTA